MSESAQQRGPDRNVESGDPDVLLDIPKVSVDSIRLAVDGLDADLSLRARVANLLQVDAGVRVHLNGGELDINGVHAEAQLRVRLEQLTRILGRALDTLDTNPQIIEALARTAATTVDDVNRSAQQLAAGAAEVRAAARRSNGVLQEFGQQAGAAGPVADRAQPGPGRPGPDASQPGAGRPGPGGPGAGPGGPGAGPGGQGSGSGRLEAVRGGPGAGPGRPGAGPGGERAGAGGPGPHAGGPGPSAGGPGSQAGGPGSGEKSQPESGAPQGGRAAEGRPHEEPRHAEGRRHGERHHPEGQRAAAPGEGKRPAGAERDAEGPAGSSTGERGNRPDQSAGPGPSPSGDRDGGGGLLGGAQSAAQLAEQAGETLRQAGRSVWEAIQSGVAQHRQQGHRDE
ncbi:hypothetical protein HNR22_004061 [Micromonospora jinlongensis]|uniref:Uncharacterized protein n=1 Tax=Micromonospora jinlongensis TaxID=1287877 RepID=A0A7Y9X3K7_9ACTN|nr:hypothetical protein [Micromonospora jinlongensis]NYH44334.1 hypothetical protein [Micromonospora jinlongensis]